MTHACLWKTHRLLAAMVLISACGVHAGETPAANAKLPVKEITIKTVQEMMRYDVKEFTVLVRQPVKLTLQNDDFVPHNLLIVKPGSADEIAKAAEALGDKGFDVDFCPDSKKILHAIKMLNYEESKTLEFNAPEESGIYEYVCTFPGHFGMMRGLMYVVTDLNQKLVPPAPVLKIVQEWKLEDFTEDFAKGGHRSFDRGKASFAKLNCHQCHKVGKEGGNIGPELTEVFKRWKNSSQDVLREILEPSRTVEEKYLTHIIAKKSGERILGVITERANDHIMVVVNPLNPVAQRVELSDIATDKASKQSPMPEGLLNFLTREEVLDLLAYLQSGGDEKHDVFKHH